MLFRLLIFRPQSPGSKHATFYSIDCVRAIRKLQATVGGKASNCHRVIQPRATLPKKIQSSLAELLPDADLDVSVSNLQTGTESAMSISESPQLGNAELFDGVPAGIIVPVLEGDSADSTSEEESSKPTAETDNGIFESYFNEKQDLTQTNPAEMIDDPVIPSQEVDEAEESNIPPSETPIAETKDVNTEADSTDPILGSSEIASEEGTATIVFGESADFPEKQNRQSGDGNLQSRAGQENDFREATKSGSCDGQKKCGCPLGSKISNDSWPPFRIQNGGRWYSQSDGHWQLVRNRTRSGTNDGPTSP